MAIKHKHTAVPNEIIDKDFWNDDHTAEEDPVFTAWDKDHADLTNVSANQHHNKQHSITSTLDHTSTATSERMLKADANGLPINATNTDAQVSSAVTASHARSHALDSTSNHSIGSLTNGRMVKNDGTKLVNATNTDADVADAVSKKHTQNTDTALGAQSQALNMNTHQINGVVDPTLNQDAATKKYVDDNIPSGALTYQTVSGTTSINTSSTTWADVANMSLTVAAAGSYLIIGSMSALNLTANAIENATLVRIIKNGTHLIGGLSDQGDSHLSVTQYDGGQITLPIVASLAVNDVVKMQWRVFAGTSRNNATLDYISRTLTIIKLA